ncbi:MAG: hypothetical protein ACOY3P_07140 [Planctomycetota bacterium]
MAHASAFRGLSEAYALAGTPIMVRVPSVFDKALSPQSVEDGKPVDPRRLQMGTTLGFPVVYEAMGKLGLDSVAYYMAFALRDQKLGGDIAAAIRAHLLAIKGGTVTDWGEVRLATPEGNEIPWQRLRFDGPQVFLVRTPDDEVEYRSMKGVIEVFLRPEAGQWLVVVFRAPLEMEQSIDLGGLAAVTCGAVTISEEAAESPVE